MILAVALLAKKLAAKFSTGEIFLIFFISNQEFHFRTMNERSLVASRAEASF